ncbi:hypothetical protein D3C81_2049320 [compost metagenome]
MAWATSMHTSNTAFFSASNNAPLASVTSGRLALPVAISMQQSLVEVSPSMVMRLNDLLAPSSIRSLSTAGATLASVAM